MPAALYNFTIEQGVSFQKTILWKDTNDNPVPLVGYTAKMQLRDRASSLILELTDANSRITITSAYGRLDLYIAPTDTAGLPKTRLYYDLDLIAPDGNVYRLLQGKAIVAARVTV